MFTGVCLSTGGVPAPGGCLLWGVPAMRGGWLLWGVCFSSQAEGSPADELAISQKPIT